MRRFSFWCASTSQVLNPGTIWSVGEHTVSPLLLSESHVTTTSVMGFRSRIFSLFFKFTVISTIFAHGMQRFGIFEGSLINFTGLSLDVHDVSKGRCAARYVLSRFKKLRRKYFKSTNRNGVQYHLLPEFKRYVTQFFQCSLLLFVDICPVIISE